MKPLVRQNQCDTILKNKFRLLMRLFEFKVSNLGLTVTLLRVHPQNRGWCIQDTVEIQQNGQMTFPYAQQTTGRQGNKLVVTNWLLYYKLVVLLKKFVREKRL